MKEIRWEGQSKKHNIFTKLEKYLQKKAYWDSFKNILVSSRFSIFVRILSFLFFLSFFLSFFPTVRPGLINVDFADVRTIMGDAGTALMGIGRGSGKQRTFLALL